MWRVATLVALAASACVARPLDVTQTSTAARCGVASGRTLAFAPAVGYAVVAPVSQQPTGLALADLDGDGKPDLIVTNSGADAETRLAGDLEVFRNRGDGTFAAAIVIARFSDGPWRVVAADLDGDGDQDLAVAFSGQTDGLHVFLNAGDGSFGPPSDYALSVSPRDLVTGDFNGDGALDLIVAARDSNAVYFLPSDGKGSFGTGVASLTHMPLSALAVGDVNNDGSNDFAGVNTYNGLEIALNDGAGYFGIGNIDVGTNPLSIALADLNGDGRLDAAIAEEGGDSIAGGVKVLSQDDTVFSTDFGLSRQFTAGAVPESVAIGDLDLDGSLDLAVANFAGASASVLLGDGHGGFAPAHEYASGGAGTQRILLGDVDGDCRVDLVTLDVNGGDVGVFLNTTL